MPSDRMLNTVLRLYQDVHDAAKTDQILGTTTTLLANLSNPLNLSLLTSHCLSSPALWDRNGGLQASLRIISVYNTAAIHVRRNELENATRRTPPVGGGLGAEAWARAVVKGADDRSKRWQHLLVLTGILMGMEGGDRRSLSRSMRGTVEHAVVTAANLALQTQAQDGPLAAPSIVLALNYAFPLLSDASMRSVHCDLLLPLCVRAMVGQDGFEAGAFLGLIDADMRKNGRVLAWPQESASFHHMRLLESKPLVGGVGPLSKLTAFCIEGARDSGTVLHAQDELVAFTGRLFLQWQATKMAAVEFFEEATALSAETLEHSWPVLWRALKKIMYATVSILQAVVARSLLDRNLRSDATASALASKSLHILRNLYFVSSRQGNSAFQVYSFTYLTSIDNISRYPQAGIAFLREILSTGVGSIAMSPLQRTLDLFYLNVAEHLPLNFPAEACDALIVQPAIVYLTHTATPSARMVELFEAAHSAILSIMSCPHNSEITARLAPYYAETLFDSFPVYISPRQFRLAFKTLMQILSPPFPISAEQPELAEALLEMVRFRALTAGTTRLPPSPDTESHPELSAGSGPVSEQSVLMLTLIDALPFLHIGILEDWMTLTACALNEIADSSMREVTKRRFWDVLASGEMDVERAAVGVSWWGTKGGRELVLFGRHASDHGDQFMMSGAIVDQSEQSRL